MQIGEFYRDMLHKQVTTTINQLITTVKHYQNIRRTQTTLEVGLALSEAYALIKLLHEFGIKVESSTEFDIPDCVFTRFVEMRITANTDAMQLILDELIQTNQFNTINGVITYTFDKE